MGYWSKPNVFKVCNFIEIPMGKHRVKIIDVSVEKFTKSKKRCYEISLKVSGQPGMIWHHIWFSPDDLERTNTEFLAFFKAFQIENHSLRSYKKWIGKTGGIYVWHEHGPTKRLEYDEYEAIVRSYLNVEELEKLPSWSDVSAEIKEESGDEMKL